MDVMMVWFIFGAVVLLIVGDLFRRFRDNQTKLRVMISLPTIETYVQLQGGTNKNAGPTCTKCGSNHFSCYTVPKIFSLANEVLIGRVHFCSKCRNLLYKTLE